MPIGLYSKAIVAAVLGGLGAAVTALEDGLITGPEWATIVTTLLVGLGAVWAIPNAPRWLAGTGKAIASGAIAALGALVTAWPGGISTAELLTMIIVFATNTGVTWAVPNAAQSDPPDLGADGVPDTPRRVA